jgi:hypothetical protein
MDTIFTLKSKKSIKASNQAVSNNNAMMRLKNQNALYQQELNRVKAENAALALEQQHREHEASVALEEAQAQVHREREARVALEQAHAQVRREREARVALEQAHAQVQAQVQSLLHREHKSKVTLEKSRSDTNAIKQESIAAPAPAPAPEPHKKGMRLNNLLHKLK